MKNKIFLLYLISITLSSAFGQIQSQESLYPGGYDISVTYQISDSLPAGGDTIIVTRTVTNNDSRSLFNLYLTDLLPDQFEPVGYDVRIGRHNSSHYYSSGGFSGFPGYTYYEWTLDYPQNNDTANTSLMPGETIYLDTYYICYIPGDYILPFHTISMHNGETGFFTVAPSATITVNAIVGFDDPGRSLPDKADIAIAYPNPFNSEVVIKLKTSIMGDKFPVMLAIHDITGRTVFKSKPLVTDTFHWKPSKGLAGGVYFYNILIEGKKYRGKLVYLK